MMDFDYGYTSHHYRVGYLLGNELLEYINEQRNRVNILVVLALRVANTENAQAINMAWTLFLIASFKNILIAWVF